MSSKYKKWICGFIFFIAMFSCDDFVLIDPPRTDLTRQTVFAGNETADAAVADIYFQIGNDGFAGGSISSITLMAALSADELVNAISWDNNYQQVNDNAIIPANSLVTFLWEDIYSCIYKCNAVLEGLDASDKISQPAKQQLIGEAKFLRAFSHFYLVNLFGDVPLVLSTDYEINQNIPRNSAANVYDQIVADLLDAQKFLPDDFSFYSGEKIRANRVVATAFLARVYLYMQEWSNAEEQASKVIGDLRYSLKTNLNEVFLKNNSEAIFQFHPRFGYPGDLSTFIEYGFHLNQDLIDSFEAGDLRNSQWNLNGTSNKYNSPTRNSEYSTVFRLAEQYLIRAEARVQQDKIQGAQDDINVIRQRAGLEDTPSIDKATLLLTIERERRVELFNEWGHRWFDLKRTNRIDAIIQSKKPQWSITDALYPIPEIQIQNSLGMRDAQNPGY